MIGLKRSEQTYLESVRRHLHRYPEISGREGQTAAYIRSELEKCSPDQIIDGVGGHGLLAIFDSGRQGPSLMLRSELDALPIRETGEHPWKSVHKNSMHACGHDGHMTTMIGVARHLSEHRPPAGRVTLLFQPAEETGEGARRMLDHEIFDSLQIQRSYAFHNLPGFPVGELLLKEGTFAAASVGLDITLEGWTSHAAWPKEGASPSRAVAGLIDYAEEVSNHDLSDPEYGIVTVTFVRIGSEAFGITPGQARVGLTARASSDERLSVLVDGCRSRLGELAREDRLKLDIEEREPFAATVNASSCTRIVEAAASRIGKNVNNLEWPFPWSEDFGHFSVVSDIALIGLGAGESHPHLHAPDYDFPDILLPDAVELFTTILKEEWKQHRP